MRRREGSRSPVGTGMVLVCVCVGVGVCVCVCVCVCVVPVVALLARASVGKGCIPWAGAALQGPAPHRRLRGRGGAPVARALTLFRSRYGPENGGTSSRPYACMDAFIHVRMRAYKHVCVCVYMHAYK